VPLPALIVPDLTHHMSQYVQDSDSALIFSSPEGTPLRHSNFTRRAWLPATRNSGMPGVHFHDLRHVGNNFTAHAGANLRELMARMGHSTTRAAMIYLHSTDARQRMIADAVDKTARAELRKAKKRAKDSGASGTNVARRRKRAS
jgi:integrase